MYDTDDVYDAIEDIVTELAQEILDTIIMRYRLKIEKDIDISREVLLTIVARRNFEFPIVSLFRGEFEENDNCEIVSYIGLNSKNRIFFEASSDVKGYGIRKFLDLLEFSLSIDDESVANLYYQYKDILSTLLCIIVQYNDDYCKVPEKKALEHVWFKEKNKPKPSKKRTATKTTTKKL